VIYLGYAKQKENTNIGIKLDNKSNLVKMTVFWDVAPCSLVEVY
jgi:hypothetical protein